MSNSRLVLPISDYSILREEGGCQSISIIHASAAIITHVQDYASTFRKIIEDRQPV